MVWDIINTRDAAFKNSSAVVSPELRSGATFTSILQMKTDEASDDPEARKRRQRGEAYCGYLIGGNNNKGDPISLTTVHIFDPASSSWRAADTKGAIPKPRSRHSAVVIGSNIYIHGGVNVDNDLHVLDTVTRLWKTISASVLGFDASLYGHTSHALLDRIFFIGGRRGTKAVASEKLVSVFDQTSKTLAEIKTSGRPPPPISRHCSAAINGRIFVIGGECLQELFVLDCAQLRWQTPTCSGVPMPLWDRHACESIGSFMYIWGGMITTSSITGNQSKRVSDNMYRLDTDTCELREINRSANNPHGRVGHSLVLLGPCVYLFGGQDQFGMAVSDVYKYETRKYVWQQPVPSNACPVARNAHQAFIYDQSMYVLGGVTGGASTTNFNRFDIERMAWEPVRNDGSDIPSDLVGHTAVVIENKVLVFGGGNGVTTRDNDLYAFMLDTGYWTKVQTSGSPPAPRVGHSAVGRKGQMVIFGGFVPGRAYTAELHVFVDEGATWIHPSVGGTVPAPRLGAVMVVVGKVLFLHGGSAGTRVFNDIHTLDISSKSKMWMKIETGDTSPDVCLHSHGGCYVKAKNKVFIFGGKDSEKNPSQKTYAFDMNTLSWEVVSVAGESPGARAQHSMVADNTRVFVFAGAQKSLTFNDLWVLDTEFLIGEESENKRRGSMPDQQQQNGTSSSAPQAKQPKKRVVTLKPPTHAIEASHQQQLNLENSAATNKPKQLPSLPQPPQGEKGDINNNKQQPKGDDDEIAPSTQLFGPSYLPFDQHFTDAQIKQFDRNLRHNLKSTDPELALKEYIGDAPKLLANLEAKQAPTDAPATVSATHNGQLQLVEEPQKTTKWKKVQTLLNAKAVARAIAPSEHRDTRKAKSILEHDQDDEQRVAKMDPERNKYMQAANELLEKGNIRGWLATIGVEQVWETFEKNEVDLQALLLCSKEDWMGMGITKQGVLQRILQATEAVRDLEAALQTEGRLKDRQMATLKNRYRVILRTQVGSLGQVLLCQDLDVLTRMLQQSHTNKLSRGMEDSTTLYVTPEDWTMNEGAVMVRVMDSVAHQKQEARVRTMVQKEETKNILHMVGYFEDAMQQHFTVLEPPQFSLHSIMSSTTSMSTLDVLCCLRDVAEGLAALHKCGLVGADLSLGNIVFAKNMQEIYRGMNKVQDGEIPSMRHVTSSWKIANLDTVVEAGTKIDLMQYVLQRQTSSFPAPEVVKCVIAETEAQARQRRHGIMARGIETFQRATPEFELRKAHDIYCFGVLVFLTTMGALPPQVTNSLVPADQHEDVVKRLQDDVHKLEERREQREAELEVCLTELTDINDKMWRMPLSQISERIRLEGVHSTIETKKMDIKRDLKRIEISLDLLQNQLADFHRRGVNKATNTKGSVPHLVQFLDARVSASSSLGHLLHSTLAENPDDRISMRKLLNHPIFKSITSTEDSGTTFLPLLATTRQLGEDTEHAMVFVKELRKKRMADIKAKLKKEGQDRKDKLDEEYKKKKQDQKDASKVHDQHDNAD